MKGIIEEADFYKVILECINKDLEKKSITLRQIELKQVSYFIGYRQYYHIKNISEGKKAPLLSNTRLEKLCKELNIVFERRYNLISFM